MVVSDPLRLQPSTSDEWDLPVVQFDLSGFIQPVPSAVYQAEIPKPAVRDKDDFTREIELLDAYLASITNQAEQLKDEDTRELASPHEKKDTPQNIEPSPADVQARGQEEPVPAQEEISQTQKIIDENLERMSEIVRTPTQELRTQHTSDPEPTPNSDAYPDVSSEEEEDVPRDVMYHDEAYTDSEVIPAELERDSGEIQVRWGPSNILEYVGNSSSGEELDPSEMSDDYYATLPLPPPPVDEIVIPVARSSQDIHKSTSKPTTVDSDLTRQMTPKISQVTPKISQVTPKISQVTPKISQISPKTSQVRVTASRSMTPKMSTPKVSTPKMATPKMVTPKVVTPKMVSQQYDTMDYTTGSSVEDMCGAINRHCSRLAAVLRSIHTYTIGGVAAVTATETQIHANKLLRAIESIEQVSSSQEFSDNNLWLKCREQIKQLRWEAEGLMDSMMSLPYSVPAHMPYSVDALQGAIISLQRRRADLVSTLDSITTPAPSERSPIGVGLMQSRGAQSERLPPPSKGEDVRRPISMPPRRLSRAVSAKRNVAAFYEHAKTGLPPTPKKDSQAANNTLAEFRPRPNKEKKKGGLSSVFRTLRKKDNMNTFDYEDKQKNNSTFWTLRGTQALKTEPNYGGSLRTFSRKREEKTPIRDAPALFNSTEKKESHSKMSLSDLRKSNMDSQVMNAPPALISQQSSMDQNSLVVRTHSEMEKQDSRALSRGYGSTVQSASGSDMVAGCGGCGENVDRSDAHAVTSKGQEWHTKCTVCSVCKSPFGDNTIYEGLDGQLFCLEHFYRAFHFCPKCNNMMEGDPQEDAPWNRDQLFIRPFPRTSVDPGVIHLFGRRWHAHCLACNTCDQHLDAQEVSIQIDNVQRGLPSGKQKMRAIRSRAYVNGGQLYCQKHQKHGSNISLQ
ncbi:hypothetical protein PROFUN_08913 [Planoprotostelium fungivorum]|uniref:LIM zinc-binding domain-containing protein n=1 Tax=Planoprotostelium fungivorum TaxID=1890364 RepID=A0A2P6NIW2_9EUKA|nr:hypothetical protein PROFUN_08913 [Planoprotostelium fungivorum]